jgi:hypothetical protein
VGLRGVIPWEIAVVLGTFDPIDHRALELLRKCHVRDRRVCVGLTEGESGLSRACRAELIRSCTPELGTIEIACAEHLPRADVLVALAAPDRWQEVANQLLLVPPACPSHEAEAREALVQYQFANPVLALLQLREAVPLPAYRCLLRALPSRSGPEGI